MNIHEYQSKEIFAQYGINVPKGQAVFSAAEAIEAAKDLASPITMVKAQIHAGGRGKAGGVKLAKSIDDVECYASELLGKTLVTHQTGPKGKVVKRLLIESGCNIAKEYYVSFVIDRTSSRVVLMASSEGGMDIEEVAATMPEKIIRETIDPMLGLPDFQARRAAFDLGLNKELVNKLAVVFQKLYRIFIEKDCSLVEVNPMVLTKENEFMAIDAKINFDDSALYRHPEIKAYRDMDEEDKNEIEAAEYGLSYITLDGNIGCMVNGAGLAMATMDIIKYYGGEPANFLDVGGQTTVDTVKKAFAIILRDKKVKGIFVNIFGGINRCDVVAEGLVEAAKQMELTVPIVVRLDGTKVEEGREIIRKSGVSIVPADTLADGAEKVVKLAGQGA